MVDSCSIVEDYRAIVKDLHLPRVLLVVSPRKIKLSIKQKTDSKFEPIFRRMKSGMSI